MTVLLLAHIIIINIISIVPSSTTETEDVYGCLYTVILNIIVNQNYIIESLYSMIERDPHNSLAHLVPKKPSQIQLNEVNGSDAIISSNKKYVFVMYFSTYTVEPLTKGQFGTAGFVFYKGVFLPKRLTF